MIYTFMHKIFSTWVVTSWMHFRRGLYSFHNFCNAKRICQRSLSKTSKVMWKVLLDPGSTLVWKHTPNLQPKVSPFEELQTSTKKKAPSQNSESLSTAVDHKDKKKRSCDFWHKETYYALKMARSTGYRGKMILLRKSVL